VQHREKLRKTVSLNYKLAALNQLSYAGKNARQSSGDFGDEQPVDSRCGTFFAGRSAVGATSARVKG